MTTNRRPALTPLLLLVGLLTPVLAGAAETLLGAPRYDHATETTYRRVTWDDFKGTGKAPPGWSRWQPGSFAHIATVIKIGAFEVAVREAEGGWVAEPVGIRPYAVMNKDFSAVKHGSKNAYTLAHEQLHFDVAELVARRMAVRLAALEGSGATPEEARRDLDRKIHAGFEAGLREHGMLQGRYDRETGHGTRKKQQKKWAAAVPEMLREATGALAALLEQAGE